MVKAAFSPAGMQKLVKFREGIPGRTVNITDVQRAALKGNRYSETIGSIVFVSSREG